MRDVEAEVMGADMHVVYVQRQAEVEGGHNARHIHRAEQPLTAGGRPSRATSWPTISAPTPVARRCNSPCLFTLNLDRPFLAVSSLPQQTGSKTPQA